MIEDYYKILNLTPKAGAYKIAIRYKRIVRNHLELFDNSTSSIDFLYKINRAFEVLRNEELKKFYDILYKKQFIDNAIILNNPTLEKYLGIINDNKLKGDTRTVRLLNETSCQLRKDIVNPIALSFIGGVFSLYSAPDGTLLLQQGLLFLIVGTVFLLKLFWQFNPAFIIMGAIFFLVGFSFVYSNFRQFTIDLMNEKIK